jgi:hypothetical protein
VVDGSGLENRQSESSRGFESHPLRHLPNLRSNFRLTLAPRPGATEIRTPFDWWARDARGLQASSQARAKA